MVLRRYGEAIWGWSRFQPDRGYEFSGTALGGADGRVFLVDPIRPTDEELAALRALGHTFEIILLNAHHERDAARLAEHFAAPVWVHASDEPLLRLRTARTFESGATFGDWTAQGVDDHKTPGETVLHNANSRVLLVGDAVIADPVTGLRLPPPKMLSDRFKALAALAKLLELDFDALLAGDGFQLLAGGHQALERFLEREGALVRGE